MMKLVENVSEAPAYPWWIRRVQAAAVLSVVAGVAHLWATPEHSGYWWGYSAFFLGVGIGQTLYGFLLPLWPHPLLFAAGIWANIGVIFVYVVTRTGGIPIGPHAGVVEDATPFDVTTTVMELGLVFVLVSLLKNTHRAWTVNALLLVGVTFWVLRFTGSLP